MFFPLKITLHLPDQSLIVAQDIESLSEISSEVFLERLKAHLNTITQAARRRLALQSFCLSCVEYFGIHLPENIQKSIIEGKTVIKWQWYSYREGSAKYSSLTCMKKLVSYLQEHGLQTFPTLFSHPSCSGSRAIQSTIQTLEQISLSELASPSQRTAPSKLLIPKRKSSSLTSDTPSTKRKKMKDVVGKDPSQHSHLEEPQQLLKQRTTIELEAAQILASLWQDPITALPIPLMPVVTPSSFQLLSEEHVKLEDSDLSESESSLPSPSSEKEIALTPKTSLIQRHTSTPPTVTPKPQTVISPSSILSMPSTSNAAPLSIRKCKRDSHFVYLFSIKKTSRQGYAALFTPLTGSNHHFFKHSCTYSLNNTFLQITHLLSLGNNLPIIHFTNPVTQQSVYSTDPETLWKAAVDGLNENNLCLAKYSSVMLYGSMSKTLPEKLLKLTNLLKTKISYYPTVSSMKIIPSLMTRLYETTPTLKPLFAPTSSFEEKAIPSSSSAPSTSAPEIERSLKKPSSSRGFVFVGTQYVCPIFYLYQICSSVGYKIRICYSVKTSAISDHLTYRVRKQIRETLSFIEKILSLNSSYIFEWVSPERHFIVSKTDVLHIALTGLKHTLAYHQRHNTSLIEISQQLNLYADLSNVIAKLTALTQYSTTTYIVPTNIMEQLVAQKKQELSTPQSAQPKTSFSQISYHTFYIFSIINKKTNTAGASCQYNISYRSKSHSILSNLYNRCSENIIKTANHAKNLFHLSSLKTTFILYEDPFTHEQKTITSEEELRTILFEGLDENWFFFSQYNPKTLKKTQVKQPVKALQEAIKAGLQHYSPEDPPRIRSSQILVRLMGEDIKKYPPQPLPEPLQGTFSEEKDND